MTKEREEGNKVPGSFRGLTFSDLCHDLCNNQRSSLECDVTMKEAL